MHLYWYMVNVCRESQRQSFHRLFVHFSRFFNQSLTFFPQCVFLYFQYSGNMFYPHTFSRKWSAIVAFRSRRSMTWRARWGWSGSGGSWETLACDGRVERSHKEVSDTHIFFGQLVSRCYFPRTDACIWQLCLTRAPEQVERSLECPLDAELICTHISQI